MEQAQFRQMVARLEQESRVAPRAYLFKVGALATLGFAILALVIGLAGLGIALLAGLGIWLLLSGSKAILLLLKFGKVVFALGVALWLLLRSSLRALLVRLPAPQGIELTSTRTPQLFRALGQLQDGMHGPRFHRVLLNGEVNAAVIQQPLFGLFGPPRNYLVLGLPLLECLSPEEALAALAHEYAHLAGAHAHFASYIYRLRLSWGSVQHLAQQWQGHMGRLLQRLVDWYAPYFNAYTFVLARANEYQADAASARLVGTPALGRALKRTRLAAADFQEFLDQTYAQSRDLALPPGDMAKRWAEHAERGPDTAKAQAWLHNALRETTDAGDTHPTLLQRLQALPAIAAAEALPEDLPQTLDGPSAAQHWLGAALPDLREVLQRQWSQDITANWAERHRSLQSKRQRLGELEAVPQAGAAQQIEILQLRMQLEPSADHLPQLLEFNARHADHPLGMFLEGSMRLRNRDESGLACLERVQVLDPEAIKAACELAYNFLRQRQQTERAEEYLQRWRAQDALERQRRHEFATLSVLQELHSPKHSLEAEDLALARRMAAKLSKGVKHAYLARRILPSDPEHPAFLIGLELNWWSRVSGQQAAILQRFADQQWPMPTLICALHGSWAQLGGRLRGLDGAQLSDRADLHDPLLRQED